MGRDLHTDTITLNKTITEEGGATTSVLVPLASIDVTVFKIASDGSETAATIYQARTGATAGPTPAAGASNITSNGFRTGVSGSIQFYADVGEYRIHLHDSIIPARISDRDLYWNSAPMQTGSVPTAALATDASLPLGALGADVLRQALPIGGIIDWWRPTISIAVPSGFAICNGQTISSANHDFGTGSSIVVPDLRKAFVRGADNTLTDGGAGNATTAPGIGGSAGEQTHVLSAGEMPSHDHPLDPSGDGWWVPKSEVVPDEAPFATGSAGRTMTVGSGGHVDAMQSTGAQGSGAAHNNMPLYVGLLKIIKVKRS